MSEARDIEMLFALWEQNVETVRAINRTLGQQHLQKSGIAPQLVAHLKQSAVALAKKPQFPSTNATQNTSTQQQLKPEKIDTSVLTISQPRRIRSKEHLRYVASQPCAVCGRTPSHAHHVRYAQPRGLGLKGSDEFTVPLCATHHHHLHETTQEREWWLERKIDPLIIAQALWQQSQRRLPDLALAISSPNTLTVAAARLSDRPVSEESTSRSSDEAKRDSVETAGPFE